MPRGDLPVDPVVLPFLRETAWNLCQLSFVGEGYHTNENRRRAGYPGRPPSFDPVAYRRRNVVERCVNRLKQWRGIATRYEKRASNYRAIVVIAALLIWLTS